MTKKIFEWVKTQKLHLIGWSAFIIFEIGLVGLSIGFFGKPLNYLLHYVLNIILFYSNAHLVLKKGFNNKNPWTLVAIYMFIQIILYIVLRTVLNFILAESAAKVDLVTLFDDYKSIFQSIWRGLFFIGLSCFYYLFLEYKDERIRREHSERQEYLNQIRNKEIQNELNIAKYEYLRAQINPHLLFNTLSFLYDSIRKHNEKAGEAVLNLADLMRFSLESKEAVEEIPRLEEELNQVNNLISLNKIRKNQEQYIDLSFPEDAKNFRFIPLVIITLVENMLKHGNLQKSNHPGILKIGLDNEYFSIFTTNLINTRIQNSGFNKGMDNIEKRLELAYGGKFTFHYAVRDENNFDVKLIIKI